MDTRFFSLNPEGPKYEAMFMPTSHTPHMKNSTDQRLWRMVEFPKAFPLCLESVALFGISFNQHLSIEGTSSISASRADFKWFFYYSPFMPYLAWLLWQLQLLGLLTTKCCKLLTAPSSLSDLASKLTATSSHHQNY